MALTQQRTRRHLTYSWRGRPNRHSVCTSLRFWQIRAGLNERRSTWRYAYCNSKLLNKEKAMPQYFISYLGGNKPSSPEEGKRHFAKYKEWLSSLGDSVISPANPFKNTSTVNPDGTVTAGSTTSMSGYTIIEADSMEAALSMAKACPFLDIGGSLEVSELIEMPRQK